MISILSYSQTLKCKVRQAMTVSWSCSGVDVESGGLNMKGDSRVNFLLLLTTLSDAYINRSIFKLKIWWGFFYIYIHLHRADCGFASIVCLPVCLAVREITQKGWMDFNDIFRKCWQWERNRWLNYGEVQNNPILYYGWDETFLSKIDWILVANVLIRFVFPRLSHRKL